MRKLFRNPTFQFIVFLLLIISYSIVAKASLEESFSTFLGADAIPEASPSPSATPAIDISSSPSTESAVVSEVIDGDTIRLSTGKVVRYIGIDTPETVHPTIDTQCFGNEAGAANELWVMGKTVQLEKDVSETDRYGRLLRYVWLDGTMINEKLVKEGYAIAKAYSPDVKYQTLFENSQLEAQKNKMGLWSSCTTK